MYVNIHGNILEIYAHIVKNGTTSGRLMDYFLSFKKSIFFHIFYNEQYYFVYKNVVLLVLWLD